MRSFLATATAALFLGTQLASTTAHEAKSSDHAAQGLSQLLRREVLHQKHGSHAQQQRQAKFAQTRPHDTEEGDQADVIEDLAKYVATGQVPAHDEDRSSLIQSSQSEEGQTSEDGDDKEDGDGEAAPEEEEQDSGEGAKELAKSRDPHVDRKELLMESIKRLLDHAEDKQQAMKDVRRIFQTAQHDFKNYKSTSHSARVPSPAPAPHHEKSAALLENSGEDEEEREEDEGDEEREEDEDQ